MRYRHVCDLVHGRQRLVRADRHDECSRLEVPCGDRRVRNGDVVVCIRDADAVEKKPVRLVRHLELLLVSSGNVHLAHAGNLLKLRLDVLRILS